MKYNINHLVVIFIFLCLSCGEDDSLNSGHTNNIRVRDAEFTVHEASLEHIMKTDNSWKDYSNEALVDIYNQFGDIHYLEGIRLIANTEEDASVFSFPLIEDNEITGILVGTIYEDKEAYSFYPRSILEGSVISLVNLYGKEYTMLTLSSYVQHSIRLSNSIPTSIRNNMTEIIRDYDLYSSPRCTLVFEPYTESADLTFNEETQTWDEFIYISYGGWYYENCWGTGPYVFNNTGTYIVPDPHNPSGGNGSSNDSSDDNSDEDEEIDDTCGGRISALLVAKLSTIVEETLNDINLPCEDRSNEEVIAALLESWCRDNSDKESANGKVDKLTDDDLRDLVNSIPEVQFNAYIENLNIASSCSQTYIDELISIFGNSDCDIESFSDSYRAYFGITETTDVQVIPIIGIDDMLCPSIFSVTSVMDGLHVSGGISNLKFQALNNNNELVTVSHPYIQIMLNTSIANCDGIYDHSEIMAEVVNYAIDQVQALMVDFSSYEELNNNSDFGGKQIIDDVLAKLMSIRLDEMLLDCTSNVSQSIVLSNTSAWGDVCNTVYNNLNTEHINGCP